MAFFRRLMSGQLYISDLNNVENPYRLGSAARVDDIECLDWNKKVAHILVTGSSGGFVTVWDVKSKKESLTLNNMGRKAVSAVAWDPERVRSPRWITITSRSLTSTSPRNSLPRHRSNQTRRSWFGIFVTLMPQRRQVPSYVSRTKCNQLTLF